MKVILQSSAAVPKSKVWKPNERVPGAIRLQGQLLPERRPEIVEPFGSDFTLEPIDELCDGPGETQERAFALGKLGFDFFRRGIEAIDDACERAGVMSAGGKLVLEVLCDVQKYARALKAKIVFECGK